MGVAPASRGVTKGVLQWYASCVNVPHNRLTFGEEEVQAVSNVVKSGQWAGGPRVEELEGALSARAGVKHAVAVGSGLSALRLALQGLGVKQGDEVIVPAYSCVALANAPLALGAIPVPADVREGDFTIDPESIRSHVTSKTKAIVIVHTFGAAGPIDELRDLKIPLVEDCAHAFGIKVKGKFLGSNGDAAILSLYATKLMGAGRGGVVLTNRSDVADLVRSFRWYNDEPMSPLRHNDPMTDIDAALALSQLKRLDTMLKARQRMAEKYEQKLRPLADASGVFSLPEIGAERVWYRYVLTMKSSPAKTMADALRKHGVHAELPVTDWRGKKAKALPVSDRAYTQVVSLPCYPTLTKEEQETVCSAVESALKEIA